MLVNQCAHRWHPLVNVLLALALTAAAIAVPTQRPDDWPDEPPTGYSLGNFGISAQPSIRGRLFADVRVNPSHLGADLASLGQGFIQFCSGNSSSTTAVCVNDFDALQPGSVRTWPEYRATYGAVNVNVFAPLSPDESWPGFVPALVLEFTNLDSSSVTVALAFQVSGSKIARAVGKPEGNHRLYAESYGNTAISAAAAAAAAGAAPVVEIAQIGAAWVACNATDDTGGSRCAVDTSGGSTLVANLTLPADSSVTGRLVLGYYDAGGLYAGPYADAAALAAAVLANASALSVAHRAFVASLPSVGDGELDAYLRWYTSAGVMLTKGVLGGGILTMGYVEFNQRDSFWASWIHAYFWPDVRQASFSFRIRYPLDAVMLLEAMAAQEPSGKIPTCILPEIERPLDIDITAYFVLRAARHFRLWKDHAFGETLWPAVRNALAYLDGLSAGRGVPEQHNFWADWKDVPQVDGRLYAPHFVLVYIAAVQDAISMGLALGKLVDVALLQTLLQPAVAFAASELWNGTHYVDRWQPGRGYNQSYLLMDQAVGVLLGAVPAALQPLVSAALLANEGDCGLRETYPYIKNWDGPGEYHNGGIWPWLSMVDIATRYRLGAPADAERIFRKVGRCGLAANQRYTPCEYLNGDTGAVSGHPVQAWDAAAFAVGVLGAVHVDSGLARDAAPWRVRVNLPPERVFRTHVRLADGGWLRVARTAAHAWPTVHYVRSPLHGPIPTTAVCGSEVEVMVSHLLHDHQWSDWAPMSIVLQSCC